MYTSVPIYLGSGNPVRKVSLLFLTNSLRLSTQGNSHDTKYVAAPTKVDVHTWLRKIARRAFAPRALCGALILS